MSELSKPVAEIKCHEDLSLSVVNVLDGFSLGRHPVYSQEYVSALLAELEAKDKRITDMENVVAAAKCDDELWDAMVHRLKTLEAKLATPVRLPEPCVYEVNGTRFYDRLSEAEVIASLREQGFTVEGNE